MPGNAANNSLSGAGGNDRLDGRAGNDWMDGGIGIDTLTGGTGNDTLQGGLGNDTYLFNRGDGADTWKENDATLGNLDTARFGADIAYDQLWFRHVGNDLEARIIGTTDKVLVKNWYSGSANHIERFEAGGKSVFDTNHDGKNSAADTQFNQLRVWQDKNGDGITNAGELKTLAQTGMVSLNLAAAQTDWVSGGNRRSCLSAYRQQNRKFINFCPKYAANDPARRAAA